MCNLVQQTLTKAQRLKTPFEFKRVYQSSFWGVSQLHTYNVCYHPLNSDARLGVTVSKKVSKKAVTRNQIKRQIREYFRQNQTRLYNIDLVITAKPNCVDATRSEQKDSLNLIWNKVIKWQRWYHHNHLVK